MLPRQDDIDDIIDEAEELLRLTLGFAPDELVHPEEVTKRAKEMVDGFQKRVASSHAIPRSTGPRWSSMVRAFVKLLRRPRI